ncbi:MAG TPA: pyruvate dehydrogenase complex dihydrolipoamide acetyltransferase [Balneolales bacterium]|nr:pyruvate dehydrogenase complex dihydrolipoamide acetyltransferase [Balneolales bacterium]
MAVVVQMPKLSDTMEEGVIAKWKVEEGDDVKSGDIIAEVETDKATMDVEVFDDGKILKIMADEGDAVPLGGKIAIIGEEGEDISDLVEDQGEGQEKEKVAEEESESGNGQESGSKDKKSFDPLFGELNGKSKTSTDEEEDGRIKASPLARNMAADQGIDLSKVNGSGPNGRIIKRDIESYEKPAEKEEAVAAAPQVQPAAEDKDIKISQMRKTIARRLAESKFSNPHYYETMEIDMKKAIEIRSQLNEMSDVKISFNDLIVKASAVALRQHPLVNSSWLDDVIRQHAAVNVAIAVAIDEGLLTPVIRNTDMKGLQQIAKESKDLAGKARNRELQPEDWEGSTFTISNLGMYGIEEFTAIINPPNSCILAVGGIKDVPVVEDGEVVPGKRMKVTLSSDHRIVDGATAAEFLNTLKDLLENPMGMLL